MNGNTLDKSNAKQDKLYSLEDENISVYNAGYRSRIVLDYTDMRIGFEKMNPVLRR